MNTIDRVAVCSRSFSQNIVLRQELLARYQHVTFNETGTALKGDSLMQFLREHEKAITALEPIDDALLAQLPNLRVISKYGVGLDMIDLEAMKARGKVLGWSPGVNRRSVAELVISLAIALLRELPSATREMSGGVWRPHSGGQLSGRTVGIVGCGAVGKDLVSLLQPFDCRILVNDIRRYTSFYAQYDLTPVELDRLLAESDVITLHVPLDSSTRGLIDGRRLGLMKSSSVLINTARGGLVDEAALKRALMDGRLAAAAFDVFDPEPPVDLDLLSLSNFLATPHIGGSAQEAIMAMGRAAIENLDRIADLSTLTTP